MTLWDLTYLVSEKNTLKIRMFSVGVVETYLHENVTVSLRRILFILLVALAYDLMFFCETNYQKKLHQVCI